MNGRTTITALYDFREDGQRVVRDLLAMGIDREDVSMVINDAAGEYKHYHGRDFPDEAADMSGLRSLVVGLAALDIPGIGPVLAAGPIASALIAGGIGAGVGAVAGGLVGALVDLGLSEEEAGYYAEGVRRGGTLLVATTTENMSNRVMDVMDRHNAVDIEERATAWRESGWAGYDPDARPYSIDEIRIEQRRTQRIQSGGTYDDPDSRRYHYGDYIFGDRGSHHGDHDWRDRDPDVATWGSTRADKPRSLRLDTALPSQVQQHRSFELAVAIRQPESPVLQEDDLDQTKSEELQVEWPEDAGSIALRIQISAPECTIQKDSCSFRLYRDKDSPIFYFHLIPEQAGRIGIIVTVYQEQEWLGGTRLHTVAQEQVAGKMKVNVYSRPIRPEHVAQVAVALHIKEHFSPTELNMLCSQELGIDYNDLAGETHTSKAWELVRYIVRRGRFHELVRACRERRDNVDWEALAGIITAGDRAE
jgi:hypothetical protein